MRCGKEREERRKGVKRRGRYINFHPMSVSGLSRGSYLSFLSDEESFSGQEGCWRPHTVDRLTAGEHTTPVAPQVLAQMAC